MRAIVLSAAALAALAAARPAAAQAVGQARPQSITPAAAPATPRIALPSDAAGAVPRAVATYEVRVRHAAVPTRVTVADSAGTLVASYRVDGAAAPLPMTVGLRGSDLLLSTDTPDGLLTIVLHQQGGAGGAAGDAVTGHWRVGAHGGLLRGRVQP